ncbi:MAG TPA: serine/threonine-protein kinase [Pyrinomonadaceae bacterium]|jgi:serine/threonine protein kinase
MNTENLIGQVVDAKYRIERQLGKGGMGTVYLATHIGTERPVAVKVIAPQFMKRAEFVERFRREARAAGRLRHPNVVDVTDFGICRSDDAACHEMAYLVMEYLDGCTLGEVLEEEKQLPLDWSLDILEQVCSAVGAAHTQGIIHRDLKPDNIWLEPNQRGGYTVKVLDFGIAKLETPHEGEAADGDIHISVLPTNSIHFAETLTDGTQPATRADHGGSTMISEAGTAIMTAEQGTLIGTETDFSEKGTAIMNAPAVDLEGGTAILPDKKTQIVQKEDGTRLISNAHGTDRALEFSSTAELTRVGAVLGTPLYMSPEQCRGERLTARSDIYSLAVIAYQMLGGRTPFEGDFTSVMQAHKDAPPPPLSGKKVPRKIKRVIDAALSKNPEDRPQTAEAFASRLRSQSEGIGTLLRRALVIYSAHLPKFIGLTTILSVPMIFLTIVLSLLAFIKAGAPETAGWTSVLTWTSGILLGIFSAFCQYLILGTTTWIVAQYLAVPLRPVRLRPAFRATRRRWSKFAGTGILSTILTFFFGIITCGVGFLVTSVIWALCAPVVMMENLSGWKALKRSAQLVRRSVRTTVATVLLMFLIPALISGFITFFVNVTAKAFEKVSNPPPAAEQPKTDENASAGETGQRRESIGFGFGGKSKVFVTGNDMRSRLKATLLESLIQIFWLPTHILVVSFSSIVIALLYLKTRQAGGESMQDLLEQFEEDRPKSNWQQRVQQRLIQSGRVTTGKTKESTERPAF